jgi:hypothetical protein
MATEAHANLPKNGKHKASLNIPSSPPPRGVHGRPLTFFGHVSRSLMLFDCSECICCVGTRNIIISTT